MNRNRDRNGGDENENKCTICLCEYQRGDNVTALPCIHKFHVDCINLWIRTSRTCPICRTNIDQ